MSALAIYLAGVLTPITALAVFSLYWTSRPCSRTAAVMHALGERSLKEIRQLRAHCPDQKEAGK